MCTGAGENTLKTNKHGIFFFIIKERVVYIALELVCFGHAECKLNGFNTAGVARVCALRVVVELFCFSCLCEITSGFVHQFT